MMPSSNPAAVQGWVKSIDPNSGRVFYANHITRKTQWEAPDNWVEEPSSVPSSTQDETEPLPSGWEVMQDPTTKKPFYVDHERKITQWKRPKAEKKPEKKISFAPVNTTGKSFSAHKFPQFDSIGNPQQTRSYIQEASYYPHSHSSGMEVDFSHSFPDLDFSVKKVADRLRLNCPACGVLFSLSIRRHHCRLCGDVFCHNCSSSRVSLPLQGAEFEKPVRICDSCNEDVSRGNFFSMRRYLTPLQLFDPEDPDEDPNGVASPSNVNAALSALTSDLDQMVQSAEGFDEKLTIPVRILVPCVTKHLSVKQSTSDRAVRAIASLLSVGSMVGKNDYAYAVYFQGGHRTLNQILAILERSGSDRKTLFVQEKAAQAMFYLTESQVLASMMERGDEFSHSDESDPLESLDVHRTIRNMLDHSSVKKNPHLQRWATATIRNLILEDQRRTCLAINEVAAMAASGEPIGSPSYESILDQLVSTGGVMILCSLVGADDADTRAHATGALGAILTATRAIDGSMSALAEMTGGVSGSTVKKDGNIVRAIIAGGGCGSSVSQLLLSADNTVARMGCEFIASLVLPLLEDPLGSATLESSYDCRKDDGGLGACREAALDIAIGSCLPAILSLVSESGRVSRPMELRKCAMETLAATALAIGEMGKAWADGKYEEGIERNGAPAILVRAINLFNEERVVDIALESLNSSSVQSLGSSRDTPSTRIREAAGIVLGSLTSCSGEAIIELNSRHVLPQLLVSSDDTSMTAASSLRGDAAPRCLGMLEAAASMLTFAWQHPSGAKSELLDRLMEALDAGTITHLFRVLTSKMDWESRDKSAGGMKARSAACRLLCCLFGIALTDDTSIGMKRLLNACDADQIGRRSAKGARNVLEAVLTVLQTSLNFAHREILGSASRGAHYQAALLDLVDASLLATGSMCGSSIAPGSGGGMFVKGDDFLVPSRNDDFAARRRDVCKVACEVVIRSGRAGPALLPTLLVGGFGECAVVSSLRLSLAIAQNGSKEQHMKLALSGILVPISDILRAALSRGDLYRFSAALALVRFCGPHVAAGKGGGIQAIRDAIRVATNVLALPVNKDVHVHQMKTQDALKSECISVLESLSGNAALWSAICNDALPAIVEYLRSCGEVGSDAPTISESESSALRTVLEIVQVPSHAVAAAEAGLSTTLGKIIKKYTQQEFSECSINLEIGLLAIETLHSLVLQRNARRCCDLLSGDALSGICSAIALAVSSATGKSLNQTDDIIFFGLEVLSFALSDIEESMDTADVLQSPETAAFLESVQAEPGFVRYLCASILPANIDAQEKEKEFYKVPLFYGSPPPVIDDDCGGHHNSRECAVKILFTLSVYACAIECPQSDSFWNACLLRGQTIHKDGDNLGVARSSATFCSAYLQLLERDYEALVPLNKEKRQDYENLTRPLVRYRLLESLGDSLSELTEETIEGSKLDDYMLSLLVSYNLPSIFLSVWKDPALLELTYELMKMTIEAGPDGVLHLFVNIKESVISLFDLLNHKPDSASPDFDMQRIRQLVVSTLAKLAETGLLIEAVEKFGLKSVAIKALASACLSEDFVSKKEELTSQLLASGLVQCLVELCTVDSNKDGRHKREIILTETEAEAIAQSLGRKICHMVISRYLERAKLQQYDLDEDEIVLNAPDVSLLCAMAQHKSAMRILELIGGLHALAQVAADGEPNALAALLESCKGQPLLLLEADTYLSVLSLLSDEKEHRWKNDENIRSVVEAGAFRLLSQLSDHKKGRRMISETSTFKNSMARAKALLSSCSRPCGSGTSEAKDTETVECESNSSEKQTDVLIAALSYVARMAQVLETRELLLGDEEWMQEVARMATPGNTIELQIEAVRAITNLSRSSNSDGFLTVERAGEIFQAVVIAEHSEQADEAPMANKLYSLATKGILFLFDTLPVEQQRCLVGDVALRYRKLLRSHTIHRTTKKGSSLEHGGEVAYNITSIIMIASYNLQLREAVDSNVIISLVNTVQWRYDQKTTIEETEKCSWDASVAQVLQILSRVVFQIDRILDEAEFSLQDLTKIVLMIARPGKAPTQAISFSEALEEAQKVGEPVSILAAERLARTLKR